MTPARGIKAGAATGNQHFAWFKSTSTKSRTNFLELLRADHGDYQINEDALAYMKKQRLSQVFLDALRQHESTSFADQGAWQHHLDRLDLKAYKLPITVPLHLKPQIDWRR
ncbi:hypothetical protein [Mycoavidus sp. SF9855]|uniref:hypothetical protein n=1 Tax=Mycoavidus sp. SF9855 TaxID=2968475 RepID=UPI00211BF63D|nr:hypothetical protein [Mycoavidus sp. SF9855]UUM22241.1 hypothetical protein NQD60_04010 [Mycoavidus sp. SF9855]